MTASPKTLSGKTALVTGSSGGIGAAIAQKLASQGARVAVHYFRNAASADAVVATIVAAGGEAFAVGGDVADPEGAAAIVAATIARGGGIDILVNNAGTLQAMPFGSITAAGFNEQFGANVLGLILMMQAAVPHFPAKGGRIVNLSTNIITTPLPGLAVYCAAKAAVSTLTHAFAKELGSRRAPLERDISLSESEIIHLAADISFAHTDFMWRTPGSWQGFGYYGNPAMYEELARIASRGVFDLLFFGDAAETPEIHGGDHHAAIRLGVRWPKHDMFPMVPIMARAAPGVGFGLTMSTTYHHPFHVARLYNALDHVTGGRIAWNAVTSAYKNEAANYGYKAMVEHDARYERAQEHLQVVTGLWDTVEKDAIVMDREKGYFADPEKVHLLNHKGRFYDVRGPLPVLPSPQHRPPIIQAGQSGPGMDLAATYADMQFVWRRTLDSMKDHRSKMDALLLAKGRKPRDVGMLWLMRVQAAESVAAAKEMERQFLESLPPDAGLLLLSTTYGLDFSIFAGGMRLSEAADSVKAQNTHWGLFEDVLRTNDPDMTIEEFGRSYMTGSVPALIGTPKMIVDEMEKIHFETGANGGFILSNGFSTPGNVREFVDLVVPELQRRGLSRTAYAGPTLRDNLLV